MDSMIVLGFNRVWSREPKERYQPVFLGELEDIPTRSFVPFGPSRRAWAEKHALVVGHALQFDPAEYLGPARRAAVRSRLGYSDQPTVVVSVGGTAVGADLVQLCIAAFPAAAEAINGLRMLVVCGPRLEMDKGTLPDGVEMVGYVPKLFEHFAAGDLAIVQGGGTTTLELTVLQRPFLYFPLENHAEQLLHVAPRQRRLGAGVELRLGRTTPGDLARHIRENIGREVRYGPVAVDGAQQVAAIVAAALPSS